MSVTFCTYVTALSWSCHTRLTRSNAIIVAACPIWVASYGVMPQTYIVRRPGAGSPPVGYTPGRAES